MSGKNRFKLYCLHRLGGNVYDNVRAIKPCNNLLCSVPHFASAKYWVISTLALYDVRKRGVYEYEVAVGLWESLIGYGVWCGDRNSNPSCMPGRRSSGK